MAWFVNNPALDFAFDAWVQCADRKSFQCRALKVPVDHNDPDGPTLALAVLKYRARAPRPRGTIVVHDGGPDEMVTGLLRGDVAEWKNALRRQHDIVTWDLRGLGKSEPLLRCPDAEDLLRQRDPNADEQQEHDRAIAVMQAVRSCAEDMPLVHHLALVDMAEDLERIRLALDVDKISLLFNSYAAGIGTAYAALYPGHIDRLVLTLPLSYPQMSGSQDRLPRQARNPNTFTASPRVQKESASELLAQLADPEPNEAQLEEAIAGLRSRSGDPISVLLPSFLLHCHRMPACPLGDRPMRTLLEVFVRVQDDPPIGRDGRVLTSERLASVVHRLLGEKGVGWRLLLRGLAALHDDSDPEPLLKLASVVLVEGVDGSGLYDYAMWCAPGFRPDAGTESVGNTSGARNIVCDPSIPGKPHPLPTAATYPALIIAGDMDATAPPAHAQQLAHRLDAPLVVMKGVGHQLADTCGEEEFVRFLTAPEPKVLESQYCVTKKRRKRPKIRLR